MGREIERKFLLKNDGWRRKAGSGRSYRQGYLSTEPERSVRVRVGGDDAFLTIKGKTKGAARDEFEYPIPKRDAEELLKICVQPLIEKTRYDVKAGSLKWEVDEFEGDNRGLAITEIELERDDQEIDLPDWVGDEVTGDARYFNLNLIKHPYSTWGRREKT